MNNLSKVAVCIRSQSIGSKKLSVMVKEMQAVEPVNTMAEDNKKILLKILSEIENLQDIAFVESLVATSIVDELIGSYGHTEADIGKSLTEIVNRTNTSIKDQLKDATDLDEFNQVFHPK